MLKKFPASATQPGDELVSLNLPENAPLKVLLDYVSQEFGLNILYEETVAGQRVTIKAPARMPGLEVAGFHQQVESAFRTLGLDAGYPVHLGRRGEILEIVRLVDKELVHAKIIEYEPVVLLILGRQLLQLVLE